LSSIAAVKVGSRGRLGHRAAMALFQEAGQTLAEEGGRARASCDDLTLCGPPVLVWRTLASLKQGAFEQLGLVLQEIKTTAFAPLGAPSLETKPPDVQVGVNVGTAATRAGVIGHGVMVAGTPVGDKGFVLTYVMSETDRVMGPIDPVH